MKTRIALLAGFFALLPYGLQAQTTRTAKPQSVAPVMAASAPAGSNWERVTDACTTAPRSEWFPEDEMRLLAEHRGYRIKTFKVAKKSCYEIYGFDREGRIVEAYFDPVTTRLVRQNMAR